MSDTPEGRPVVQHYSDVLCVWAYVANIRLERLIERYRGRVDFELRCCSVFPDAVGKIGAAWEERGGFAAYGAHVQKVVGQFDHVTVSPDVWSVTRPVSSSAPHIMIKAAELEERAGGAPAAGSARRFSWALRRAFFEQGRDISCWDVLFDVAGAVGFDAGALQEQLRSGAAAAALDRDIVAAQKAGISGSPTFYMNDGRQILYGNVGYRLLEANVEELLRPRGPDEASWY